MTLTDQTIWYNLKSGRISPRPDGTIYGPRGTALKPRFNKAGQPRVQLRGEDGKWRQALVARIMFMAYNPEWEGQGRVYHEDGDASNNNFRNLRATENHPPISTPTEPEPEPTVPEKWDRLAAIMREIHHE